MQIRYLDWIADFFRSVSGRISNSRIGSVVQLLRVTPTSSASNNGGYNALMSAILEFTPSPKDCLSRVVTQQLEGNGDTIVGNSTPSNILSSLFSSWLRRRYDQLMVISLVFASLSDNASIASITGSEFVYLARSVYYPKVYSYKEVYLIVVMVKYCILKNYDSIFCRSY